MMLDIMDRHKDWAVIVALVGGGQEINRGEAGLAEWGRALPKFMDWNVVASPEVLGERRTGPGFTLFQEGDACAERVRLDDSLHLRVAVRSIRAQKTSDWVNAVLVGDQPGARVIADSLAERPLLTRDLTSARVWLNQKRRGFTRAGLVGSASAMRLRADAWSLHSISTVVLIGRTGSWTMTTMCVAHPAWRFLPLSLKSKGLNSTG